MSKNILVLTGSPRKKGNTMALTAAFVEGAKEKGHTVVEFNTATKRIGGCIHCDTCWKTGAACSVKDDFADLEPLLEAASTIVFATPLYWYSFSSQIKSAIDRVYAYHTPSASRKLTINEAALLVCGAEENMSAFAGIQATFQSILHYTGWKDAGTIIANGVYGQGDIQKTDALKKAKELGKSF